MCREMEGRKWVCTTYVHGADSLTESKLEFIVSVYPEWVNFMLSHLTSCFAFTINLTFIWLNSLHDLYIALLKSRIKNSIFESKSTF
jgi:hypothetical protein